LSKRTKVECSFRWWSWSMHCLLISWLFSL
jgi:hypothetical protein